jgi:DHA1 family inner membrane transport protein
VVVGAPLLTAVSARLSQRTLLLAFMGLFALGNGFAAAAPGFGYAAPPAVGAVLALLGVGLAVIARRRAPSPQPVQA